MEVLLRSIPGLLPYPDILWHLHKQVPKGLEVCQDLRTKYRATRLRYVALCGVGALQVLRSRGPGQVEVSHLPCDPVYPPEVGYLGSHGLWYPVRTKYRATRLRYVALCGVGVYAGTTT